MRVRPAVDADWAAIHPFWQRIVAEGETYAYPEDLTSEEARALWFDGADVVVIEEDGRVLGTARMGPNRPGRGAHVGTASFMVDDAARGRGVGRRLAEHVIAWHHAAGFRGIQFNAVVETNVVAVRLWQDLGFTIVGTVPDAFRSRAHGYVGLHVMHLDLTRWRNPEGTPPSAPGTAPPPRAG
ncbi:MAG TPA: GNAT family N-acetyltransferase [Nocardioides sp.]|nr:GNAT family N-acetyltransferase [Nocardioides sp.]